MYRVSKKLEHGEFVHVASPNDLEGAVKLIAQLQSLWPGQYLIKLNTGIGSVLERKGGEVWFVRPGQTVYEAIEKMSDKGVGALLVMSEENLVGIISERDYARKVILDGKSSKCTFVKDIMTSPVVFVTPDQPVDECMDMMTRRHIRHLPVMRKEKVLGVVSIGDLVRWIVSQQEEMIEHLQNYISTGLRRRSREKMQANQV